MAITADGKVNEMLKLGKADNTVRMELDKIEMEHSVAKSSVKTQKLVLENSKNNIKNKRELLKQISLLHPIKKYRALRDLRGAKRAYKMNKNNYKIAKLQLKNAQIKLRKMRADVRKEYSAMKQNERMNNRMKKIQQEHYVSPSLSDVLEYNNQSAAYAKQIYHIDNHNPARSTGITPPKAEAYNGINRTFAKHLKEKAKAKAKELSKDTMDMARYVGNRIKDVANNPKLPEPEMEM